MLEYLRNAADKPVAKILIGILAFSFVGWGVAEWIFSGNSRSQDLVTVGSNAVSVNEFNMEKTRQLAAMDKAQQKQIYTDAAAANQFYGAILGNLATNKKVENRADDLGFVVTDKRVAREIRDFPEFQSNGAFSTLMFDTVLNNSGFSEASFADYLRRQIMRSMTLGAMSVPVPVPEFARQAAYDARYGLRKIEYVPVKFSEFQAGTPTEAQLREFYAANPRHIPETRQVSYVLVPADMARPDSYDAAYEIARAVEDDIIGGMVMKDIPAHHKAKYVTLNALGADARPKDSILNDALWARVFEMDEGIESELIETNAGFVIVRVDAIHPSRVAEFDSVKQHLTDDWRRAQKRKAAYVRANELLVDLNQQGTLPGKKTVTVSRTSGAPTDVLVAAFQGQPGKNSIVTSDDTFYVLHVDSAVKPQADSKKMAAMQTEVQNTMLHSIMDDYNAFLNRQYPAKINTKLYERMFVK